ncbi:MAG: sugar phosphate isomerase/epimerase [Parasphingorhabdus sp.]
MSHILSLAAGTLPECQPADVADAAGRAGFTHVGFTIEPDKWNSTALKDTKAAIARHNLKMLDVEVIWIPEGGKLDDSHKLIVDVGLELGAPNALVVSSEPDKGRTAEALHQLCEWAVPGNLRIALEFLMITAVRNMDDALDIIDRTNHPAAALLIDTIHFQRAGHVPDDLKKVIPDLLPYSQICDGNQDCQPDFEHYLEDAIDLRSVPGEGQLPLQEVVNALPTNIPFSLEIRSKSYRDKYPNPIERAKVIRQNMLAYCRQMNIQIT